MRCAFVYSFSKKHDSFDRGVPEESVEYDCEPMLYLGIFLYLLQIRIHKQYLWFFLFFTNMALHYPSLNTNFVRYGVDYTAYVNQAG